jgi:hypothetical protein
MRSGKAVDVLSLLASLQQLRFKTVASAPQNSDSASGIKRVLDTSPPQRNFLWVAEVGAVERLVSHKWRTEMPVVDSRRAALVLAALAFSAIALAAPRARFSSACQDGGSVEAARPRHREHVHAARVEAATRNPSR